MANEPQNYFGSAQGRLAKLRSLAEQEREQLEQDERDALAAKAVDIFEEVGEITSQPVQLLSVLKEVEEQASLAHDYIWPTPEHLARSQEEANDAIWRIHQLLRPLIAELSQNANEASDV